MLTFNEICLEILFNYPDFDGDVYKLIWNICAWNED